MAHDRLPVPAASIAGTSNTMCGRDRILNWTGSAGQHCEFLNRVFGWRCGKRRCRPTWDEIVAIDGAVRGVLFAGLPRSARQVVSSVEPSTEAWTAVAGVGSSAAAAAVPGSPGAVLWTCQRSYKQLTRT